MKTYIATCAVLMAVLSTVLIGSPQPAAKRNKARSQKQRESPRVRFDITRTVRASKRYLGTESPKEKVARLERVTAQLAATKKLQNGLAAQRKRLMSIVKNPKVFAWERRMAAYMLATDPDDSVIRFFVDNLDLGFLGFDIHGFDNWGGPSFAKVKVSEYILVRLKDWRAAQIILKEKINEPQKKDTLEAYATILRATLEWGPAVALVDHELREARRRAEQNLDDKAAKLRYHNLMDCYYYLKKK